MEKSDPPQKKVWVKCRSSRPCGGNQALIVFVKNTKTSGRVVRYKCLKCGRKFHVVS